MKGIINKLNYYLSTVKFAKKPSKLIIKKKSLTFIDAIIPPIELVFKKCDKKDLISVQIATIWKQIILQRKKIFLKIVITAKTYF
jgi:hypothetical protein